jgi:hypothetical protein
VIAAIPSDGILCRENPSLASGPLSSRVGRR